MDFSPEDLELLRLLNRMPGYEESPPGLAALLRSDRALCQAYERAGEGLARLISRLEAARGNREKKTLRDLLVGRLREKQAALGRLLDGRREKSAV